jgi:hypothetical protein
MASSSETPRAATTTWSALVIELSKAEVKARPPSLQPALGHSLNTLASPPVMCDFKLSAAADDAAGASGSIGCKSTVKLPLPLPLLLLRPALLLRRCPPMSTALEKPLCSWKRSPSPTIRVVLVVVLANAAEEEEVLRSSVGGALPLLLSNPEETLFSVLPGCRGRGWLESYGNGVKSTWPSLVSGKKKVPRPGTSTFTHPSPREPGNAEPQDVVADAAGALPALSPPSSLSLLSFEVPAATIPEKLGGSSMRTASKSSPEFGPVMWSSQRFDISGTDR